MSAAEIRKELHGYIDIADEHFLASVYLMMHNYLRSDKGIVGYTTGGEPLTKAEFTDRIRSSYEEASQGKVIANEDFLKELKTWE